MTSGIQFIDIVLHCNVANESDGAASVGVYGCLAYGVSRRRNERVFARLD